MLFRIGKNDLIREKDRIIEQKDIIIEQKDKELERLQKIIDSFHKTNDINPKDIVYGEDFKQKQAEGIAKAKDAGVKFGRPKAEVPDRFDFYMRKLLKGKCTNKYIMEKTELKTNTYYKLKKEWMKEYGSTISK